MSEPVPQAPAVDQQQPTTTDADAKGEAVEQELVVEDLLVEEISIDGMCGVY